MANIRRVAKPNIRKTVHTDSRTYKVEERPIDVRLRKPKEKPYKNK